MPGFLTFVFAAVGAVLAARDPRRLLPGVLLTLAAASLVMSLVGFILEAAAVLAPLPDGARTIVGGLLLLVIPLASAICLGAALLANGLVMVRREGRSLANLLSLIAGIGVLGFLGLGIFAVGAGWLQLAVILLLLAGPAGYIGTGFVAYLCWSAVYARIARRAPAPAAVVTLGSGLRRDGSVPPLLAQRVTLGVESQRRFAGSLLVVSGGRGDDEPRSEAAAMAEYAVSLGTPSDRLIVEDESRTTEENLTFTRGILAERAITGPVLAVTSDYHAFRAATLLRTLGMTGHAIGARSARYYRPSALLREYLALLRDHRWFNLVALALLMAPVVVFVVSSLARLLP